ncbi:quaternary amine ABC transporter ATP-binding protein [Mycolicibacterium palauense]|uniref:quaternary amine ABC transporter ATP-binding protein n=1 Tax=Mycolicibacterium palauense TaxID=2034511 RepID=UPI000BFEF0B5|nr:glycine betaine/L-proline ABC transporter ATP-binding protein [Mycolicibacterium palauense]
MPALRAEKLYKIFGDRAADAVRRLQAGEDRQRVREELQVTPAVLDASLEVEPGETFVVMGLSGSGKSTLIRMFNGLLEPTAGKVFLGDRDLTALGGKELRHVRQTTISMVFQHFALFPHRTVLDNAGFALEVRKIGKEERVEKARRALEMVGLSGWEDSLPGQLSGGMQQRVGLARALAAETEILLMDEAFSALDPLIRREMQDQLIELQHSLQKTIVFITHDLNEAMKLGDRIAVMRDGRIVQIGAAQDILDAPADDYVAQFVQDVDRSRVLTVAGVAEEPAATLTVGTGLTASVQTMREHALPVALVTDAEHKLVGALVAEEAEIAATRGDGPIDGLIHAEVPRMSAVAALADVLVPAATTSLPIAVVDDEGRLTGVVSRRTLLAALGPKDTREAGDD